MKCTASFRTIEEIDSLLQRETKVMTLQKDYLTFINHKKCDINLLHLTTKLLSDIKDCQYYIENTLKADNKLKRKDKDIIYMRALSLISGAIEELKKRVSDLKKLSVLDEIELNEVLDQIFKL